MAVALAGAATWILLLATSRPLAIQFGDIGVGIFPAEKWNVMFAIGGGWPNEKWFKRSVSPELGDAPGDVRFDFLFNNLNVGFGSEYRRWNGEVPITVWWRGLSLPGPFCVAIALAPMAQRMLRRWLIPRARRRRMPAYARWDGLCAGCKYDLRASRDCCPECGLPIPMNIIMMRARRRVLAARSRAMRGGHQAAAATMAVTETAPSTGTPPPPG